MTQLLRAKADVTCDLADSATCLHASVDQGMHEPIAALVHAGANPNARLFDGQTALHIAVRKGMHKCVAALLKSNASPNCANKSGATPLHLACTTGDIAMVRALLDAGADVSAKMTMDTERSEGVQYMNEMNGGDGDNQSISSRSSRYSLRTKSIGRSLKDQNWTCMHIACYYNFIDIVKLLHKNSSSGPRLLSEVTKSGMNPLYLAAHNGHLEIVRFLIKHRANVNIETKAGSVPLIVAAGKGHDEVVELLLNNGANANHTAQIGHTVSRPLLPIKNINLLNSTTRI